jgi:DNA-binding HxlR family transcriptional regulator
MERTADTCPVYATADLISGKWTILIIRDPRRGRG